MVTSVSSHPTGFFLQLHLPTQLHSPRAVGHWICNLRRQHRADHPSQQTLVPGTPGRTKGRLVSPHGGGGGGAAQASPGPSVSRACKSATHGGEPFPFLTDFQDNTSACLKSFYKVASPTCQFNLLWISAAQKKFSPPSDPKQTQAQTTTIKEFQLRFSEHKYPSKCT